MLIISGVFCQNRSLRFDHLTLKDGLSQGSVFSIIQDSLGYMWFGTESGLNRYDGREFLVYLHDRNDTNTVSHYFINALFIDSKGRFWIGTNSGLNRYNYEREIFDHCKVKSSAPSLNLSNRIRCIAEDRSGTIWVGTDSGPLVIESNALVTPKDKKLSAILKNTIVSTIYSDGMFLWFGTAGHGLYKYNMQTYEITHFEPNGNSGAISNGHVSCIIRDQLGDLWVGTEEGLNRFDSESGTFMKFFHTSESTGISDNRIFTFSSPFENELWIGTYNGLSIYNLKEKKFTTFRKIPNDSRSIISNRIMSFHKDKGDIIWVGTYGEGISKYNSGKNKFIQYLPTENEGNDLNYGHIRQICEDKTGNLYICTDGGGLNILDKRGRFRYFTKSPSQNTGVVSNNLSAIYYGEDNLIWIGTFLQGFQIFNPANGIFYNPQDNKDENIEGTSVRSIIYGGDDIYWLGTETGLLKYKKSYGSTAPELIASYSHNPQDPNSLPVDRINDLAIDNHGIIWIATMGGGLSSLNPSEGKFTTYKSNEEDIHSLNDNFVTHLLPEDTVLWVSTSGGGLNKMSLKTKKFTSYSMVNGLPDNTIYGMLKDDLGNIWASTNRGIFMLNPQSGEIKTYAQGDGLTDNEFNGGACFKSSTGELLFGGVNGLTRFAPDGLSENRNLPAVVIKSIVIANSLVKPGDEVNGRVLLDTSISLVKKIILTHKDNVITLEFAALEYSDPEKNDFAYKLEGFESEWNRIGHRRFASYTSLPPGKYTFRVIASNGDGVWNEEGVFLEVVVKPPWWKTKLFYALVFISVIVLFLVYIRLRVRKLKKDTIRLEKEVEKRTEEIESQKEELRSQAQYLSEINTELEKLSIVARETANAISIFDDKGNMEYRNEAFVKLYKDMLKDHVLEIGENISHFGPRHELNSQFKACLENKTPVMFNVLKKDSGDNDFWIQTTLTPILDVAGEIIKMVAIDTDITEIKKAEKKIKEQALELEKLSLVASKTDSAVLMAGADGEIEWVNEGYTRLMGYTIDDLRDSDSSNFFDSVTVEGIREQIENDIKEKKSTIYHSVNRTRNGKLIWLQTTITPLFSKKGALLRLIVIESDISKIKEAEEEIRKKNIQITDSINYAQKIQKSMLPSQKFFKECFEDFFIFFRPRDIVSGDFYWLSRQDNYIFVAVCDSTGHGVPGGFMSMMGTALLNEIVHEKRIFDPAGILGNLNTGVMFALRQNIDGEQEDGMDVSLCRIDTTSDEIIYAGANHYMCKIEDSKASIVQGGLYSIGGMINAEREFEYENVVLKYKKGDCIYLFSDGYQDQFGQSTDTKFMSGRFIDLLESNSGLDMDAQYKILMESFDDWKGNNLQIDDVLVLGIKL